VARHPHGSGGSVGCYEVARKGDCPAGGKGEPQWKPRVVYPSAPGDRA
jgi:hypothetical protein